MGRQSRTVANHIHDLIGGDIVEVEMVVPYPDTYEEVTQIAPGELESDYRPELKTKVENMDEYDTHGGSGTAQSVSDIRSVCPNSTILGSLAVYGSQAENSRGDVEKWLEQIGILKNN